MSALPVIDAGLSQVSRSDFSVMFRHYLHVITTVSATSTLTSHYCSSCTSCFCVSFLIVFTNMVAAAAVTPVTPTKVPKPVANARAALAAAGRSCTAED